MQKSQEIKDFIIKIYENFTNPSYFVDKFVISDYLIGIGSDEHEWQEGYEAVMKSMNAQRSLDPEMKIIEFNPQSFIEGKVAWFYDRVKVKFNADTLNLRVTGVLINEMNSWKFIQIHFSLGVKSIL